MNTTLHIISGLGDGGAEGVLFRLCSNHHLRRHIVISMMGDGKYGPMLRERGVEVHVLNMPRGKVTLHGLYRLYCLIRLHRNVVLQTWMYHADFIGGIMARVAGVRYIFWNVRNSELKRGVSKGSTLLIARLCQISSALVPTSIIFCGANTRNVHLAFGYRGRSEVIHNGFDSDVFNISLSHRLAFRSECGVSLSTPLIGMVARYDPQKDHDTFLRALEILKQQGFFFKCCFVGCGIVGTDSSLRVKISELGLTDFVILLGQRSDIPVVMNGLDIHVLSSSFGEGFPNVVAEAMLCGTPNVVTDVGDASHIVGNSGRVVRPSCPYSLASGIGSLISLRCDHPEAWALLRLEARSRAEKNFGLSRMIELYESVWNNSIRS